MVDGAPRVAIEAKAVGLPLSEANAAQVVQYCAVLGTEWAVVTNGREWRLYDAFARGGLPEKHGVLGGHSWVGEGDGQFDSVFEQLWLISKETFVTGGGPSVWLAARHLDRVLSSALTDPSSSEVKYLAKRASSRGAEANPEQIASWLKSRLEGHSVAETSLPLEPLQTKPPPPPFAPDTGSSNQPLVDPGRAQERCKRPTTSSVVAWGGFLGFWESTPGRKAVKAGDLVAFYASKQNEVVAYARVTADASTPVAHT